LTISIGKTLVKQNTLKPLINKSIPPCIHHQATVALSYYPELSKTPIAFKFKKNIQKSTMQAQPVFKSLLKPRSQRAYIILIAETFTIADTSYTTADMPEDIMIGWLGHELGHIMDYTQRSALNLIGFGLGYLFSHRYIKKAERTADTYAVNHGMEQYILKTKDFILNQAGVPKKYKDRIKRLYLSPEEIMELVESRDSALIPK
jgi:hypothetical protein